jgi:hypothetical protein
MLLRATTCDTISSQEVFCSDFTFLSLLVSLDAVGMVVVFTDVEGAATAAYFHLLFLLLVIDSEAGQGAGGGPIESIMVLSTSPVAVVGATGMARTDVEGGIDMDGWNVATSLTWPGIML